jgi:3-dehydroquinate synthase
MSMIRVHSNLRDYEVSFDTIKANLDAIQDNYDNRIYVIDANVWEIYKDKQLKVLEDSSPIIIPIKEEYKNLEMVQELYDKLIVHSVKRNMTLVSIGGGILQDITGFVASTLYRGVSWVFMPTTLLAQSDSCI